jgi:hypothetical protein
MRKRGRPNLGRTLTLKQRSVYAYVPTKKMLREWKADAKRHGLSLSEYIVRSVERVRKLLAEGGR